MVERNLQKELERIEIKLSLLNDAFDRVTETGDREVLFTRQQYWLGYKAGLQYLINKNS